MLNWLKKLFIPSAKTLAKLAADKFSEKVNSLEDSTADKIAKYSTLASTLTSTANTLSVMLQDAKIDESERAVIAEKLEPVFEKILNLL